MWTVEVTIILCLAFSWPAAADEETKSPEPESSGVSKEDIEYVEKGYDKLQADTEGHSLLKKHLTKEILDQLKDKKTDSFGSTLRDVIQSGVENLDSGIGIYAPDAESYTVFAALFDPVIEEYHGGFGASANHPPLTFGDPANFGDLDPEGRFVVSTRIRCGRSVDGFPFNPNMQEDQYKDMEAKVSAALQKLPEGLQGTYFPLTGMEKETQQQLIDDHFLFKEGDRFLKAANANRFWPTGRGIFHNKEKTFLVWIGEEDHLRIISMQEGGDVGAVYGRLVSAIQSIESLLPFSSSDRLGRLTFCPTNLGTTIRASVHIKIPLLAEAKGGMEGLQNIGDKYQLQVRGTAGEHSEAVGGKYDISNRERMGLTEFEAVEKMYKGVAEMIQMEKDLETELAVSNELAAEVPAIEEVAEEAPTVGAGAPEEEAATEDEAVNEDVNEDDAVKASEAAAAAAVEEHQHNDEL